MINANFNAGFCKMIFNVTGEKGSNKNIVLYAPYQPDLATFETLADEGLTILAALQDVSVAEVELSFTQQNPTATGLAGSDTNVKGALIFTQNGTTNANSKKEFTLYSPNANVSDDSETGINEYSDEVRAMEDWLREKNISLTQGATITGLLTEATRG